MLRSPSNKINEEIRPSLFKKLQLPQITILKKSFNNMFQNSTIIEVKILQSSSRKINGESNAKNL